MEPSVPRPDDRPIGVLTLLADPAPLEPLLQELRSHGMVVDVAKNLERWVDGVVVRTFAHETCVELAGGMRVPLVNALTDHEHPCQAVGDFLTIREKRGDFRGLNLVYIGDGNNVCHSLMLMAAKKLLPSVAMPVANMWCTHRPNDRNPVTTSASTMTG